MIASYHEKNDVWQLTQYSHEGDIKKIKQIQDLINLASFQGFDIVVVNIYIYILTHTIPRCDSHINHEFHGDSQRR